MIIEIKDPYIEEYVKTECKENKDLFIVEIKEFFLQMEKEEILFKAYKKGEFTKEEVVRKLNINPKDFSDFISKYENKKNMN